MRETKGEDKYVINIIKTQRTMLTSAEFGNNFEILYLQAIDKISVTKPDPKERNMKMSEQLSNPAIPQHVCILRNSPAT
jgi:hypothetical protein